MATIYFSPVVESLENSWQPLHHESKHITITTFYVLWWSFWISNTHRWTVNRGLWTIMTIFSPTTTWWCCLWKFKDIHILEGLLKNTFPKLFQVFYLNIRKLSSFFFCFRLWLHNSFFFCRAGWLKILSLKAHWIWPKVAQKSAQWKYFKKSHNFG